MSSYRSRSKNIAMVELEEILPTTSKEEFYSLLQRQCSALLEQETDLIANTANFTSLLYHSLPDVNWVGVYFFKNGELVLGPFQGRPACVRIALGRGVCGSAAELKSTVVVPNVHEFQGHIACDSQSNSEIVIPLFQGNQLLGVLDIDSPIFDRFDETDRLELEHIAGLFVGFSQL